MVILPACDRYCNGPEDLGLGWAAWPEERLEGGKSPPPRSLRKDLILGELVGAEVAKLRKDMNLRELGCWRRNLELELRAGPIGIRRTRGISITVSDSLLMGNLSLPFELCERKKLLSPEFSAYRTAAK